MANKNIKYLIIGSGISGLSFANFIKSKDYLILERDSEPGGYCKTIKQDGFTWDYAGHFFHFRNTKIKDYIFKNIDQTNILKIRKNAKIYYKDRYINYPFQKNIHELPQNEFIDCLYDLFFKPNFKPRNFKEMVLTKFGKSICEKFLFPYNEKLYSKNLNDLNINAMDRFSPDVNLKEIIRNMKMPEENSYNSFFIYSRKGAIDFVNSLLKNVDKNKLILGEEVKSIDLNNKIAKTNKNIYKYQYLISSIPFINLLSLTEHSFNKKDFPYTKVLVFNLGFDEKTDLKIHWAYFSEKKFCFYRVGFYNNILKEKKMSLYVELGFSFDDDIDVDYWLNKVLRDLKKASIIQDHKLISHHFIIMDPAYVHIAKKSNVLFKKNNYRLITNNVYSIGRYGGWKYCSIEDNIIEGKKLAQIII